MSEETADTTPVGRRAPDACALGRDRELCVVSWNVFKGRGDGLAREFQRLVAEWCPDILALQEARPDLELPEGYAGHHALSYRAGFFGPEEGVMTLARCEIERTIGVRSPQRELFVLTPKAAAISVLPVEGGESLCLVNVHGLNFDPSGRQLAKQLEGLAERISHHDGPLVVAGDFNTWNEPRMDAARGLSAALGLTEVCPDYPGGKTGDAPTSPVRKALGLDRTLHLDRLFVRGLRPVSAAWLESYGASDHVPLAAHLAWI